LTDFKDAIKSGLAEYMDGLKKAVDGLTPAELRWQPTLVSNPICWIVWHMARVEDRWVNRVLRGGVELWISDGWYAKFGMSEEAHGYGETADQVRAMPDVAMSDVLDYFDAVRQSTLAYLEQMTDHLCSSEAHGHNRRMDYRPHTGRGKSAPRTGSLYPGNDPRPQQVNWGKQKGQVYTFASQW
jgi:hypothetical protein